MLKIKYIIALFLVGCIITWIGALFKLESWPGASWLLITATIIKVIAGLLGILKAMTMKGFDGFKDLLNK